MNEKDMRQKLSDKFELLELVGTGGMAVVYKAMNKQSNRIVALKILKDEYSENKDYIRRFEKEAESLSGFSHPNIVTVYSIECLNGIWYMEMEFIEGQTLKEHITKYGAMDSEQAVDIAIQLCGALAHAHSKSIIHRDVKSQNILMLKDGTIKLADFGIARDVKSSTMTFAGNNIMGSVHYFSPEQAKGELVGEKSDIYSLGIVLYEMLTGLLPFSADNTVSLALKHINEDIIPPDVINTSVKNALSRVVVKATQKNLDDRYASMEEFREELIYAYMSNTSVVDAGVEEQRIESGRLRAKKQRKDASYRRIFSMVITASFVIILFFAMFLIGNSILSGRTNAPTQNTGFAPTLVGISIDDARILADRSGFELEETFDISDEEPGIIFKQIPAAGDMMLENGIVSVFISEAAYKLSMPMLEGKTYMEAQNIITSRGLNIGVISFNELSDAPVGTVISQSPKVDVEMQLGDEVDLWISGTQSSVHIDVPEIIGLDITEAVKVLTDNHIITGLIAEQDSGEDDGTVLSVNPGVGETVFMYSDVELVISSYETNYATDYNLLIPLKHDLSEVVVTVEEFDGVEMIRYKNSYSEKGQQSISMTLRSISAGEKNIRVYVNGTQIQKETRRFMQDTQDGD